MAASSSSDVRWKYEVFINFRGEDTHTGFISHLYRALLQKPINTFVDAEELRKGDRLCELRTGIQESRLSLVVFSQNYALSTCCLKELVEILECSYTKNQIVVPIFYQVDPATVRKLKGTFAKAFVQHDHDSNLYSKSKMVEVESWRSALTTATNISGLGDPRNYKDDAELIEEIVEDVFTKLMQFSSKLSKYDVFINFRGEDTRRGFVSHLYKALCQKSINTYIDAKELRRGDPLTKLLIAVQESKISLLVLSENYASSTWSLKELVEIWKSKNTKNQIVLPIFYQVNPSDVRGLERSFAEAFAQHDLDSNAEVEMVRSWRHALRTTPHLPGWVSGDFGDDAKLIEEIVEDVSRKLIHISSTSSKDNVLVEMDSHMLEMHVLLNPPGFKTNDVRIVGICGMGGLGKTTIARAVYDEISFQFEASCFLENIREGFMKQGTLHMQAELLSSISNNKVGSSDISKKGFQVMLNSLGQRKVLIVLDDVDRLDQIEALLGGQHSFYGGSRIIITTRDGQLLSLADAVYRPNVLSDLGALKLFRRYAFRTNQPTRDYDNLSRRVIQYAQGLPLALKVLGAFLDNKIVPEWEEVLEELRRIPHRGIHDVLRTSFNGLDDTEKEIFLDIACFFKGMKKDYATEILDSCGFYPHTGIRVLFDRALITVSEEGKLEIHDLLVEMGREIVHQESLKEPGRRSRLWSYEDVYHVLTQNTGTEAVESITMSISNDECLNAEAFVGMTQLRLLKISQMYSIFRPDYGKQHLNGHLEFLSSQLRCLSWHGFPRKSLPSTCQFENLVDIDMRYSRIERLWEGIQKLEKLKFINLSYCLYLEETPNFTEMPNLEKLILRSCTSLVEVHPSISTLTNLVLLNLNGCKKLKILASSIRMQSLETLDLSGCSNLEMFPEPLEVMKKLSELNLSGSKIKELPLSIRNLTGLRILGLEY
ncbi:TMV resistance protein N-like isoform X2 [Malus sylvestris]|uniref:TMV resistance protein N-like isoform X2 n=1 Tax=Malus sylvestris TaxID=3752 RepID=UPI0021AC25E8|nr:TMV resistance protein N-like isoform X2 [Malus sylvestris]